jgi:hypothetical protein
LEEARGENREITAQLTSAQEHIASLERKIRELEREKIDALDMLYETQDTLQDAEEAIVTLTKEKKDHLSYDDLKPGGRLAKHVGLFTFFDDFECNNAFLDVINHTIGRGKGKGVCENLVRYSNITVAARKKWNEEQNGKGNTGDDADIIQDDPVVMRGGGDDENTGGEADDNGTTGGDNSTLRSGGDLIEGAPEFNWLDVPPPDKNLMAKLDAFDALGQGRGTPLKDDLFCFEDGTPIDPPGNPLWVCIRGGQGVSD